MKTNSSKFTKAVAIIILTAVAVLAFFSISGAQVNGNSGLSPTYKVWYSKNGFVSDTLYAERIIANKRNGTTDTIYIEGLSGSGNALLVSPTGGIYKGAGGGGSYNFANGLTLSGDTVLLGGTLNSETIIDTDENNFSLSSQYAALQSGNFFGVSSLIFNKDISPTEKTVVGLLDLSPFALDSDVVFMGRLSLLGAPSTQIQINPSSGNTAINSVNNTTINSVNNTTINSVNNTTINSVNNTTINSGNKINGTVGNLGIVANEYKVDYAFTPFESTPSVVIELKKNQEFSVGWAALDGGSKQYSNIYYGVLDSLNNINDITRVEANQDYVELMTAQDAYTVKLYNNGNFITDSENVVILNLNEYVDDAAADADVSLPSKGLYKLVGSRAIYQKP